MLTPADRMVSAGLCDKTFRGAATILQPDRKDEAHEICIHAADRRRHQGDGVDAEFARLKDKVEVVHEPKVMPWGNRTAQFRDPEGTLVGLYTPVSDAAKKRFASR